jgi:hypothetical protein
MDFSISFCHDISGLRGRELKPEPAVMRSMYFVCRMLPSYPYINLGWKVMERYSQFMLSVMYPEWRALLLQNSPSP